MEYLAQLAAWSLLAFSVVLFLTQGWPANSAIGSAFVDVRRGAIAKQKP